MGEEEEERTEEVQKKIMVYELLGVLIKINEVIFERQAMDPNAEHFNNVECVMREFLKCYTEIY